MPEFKVSYDDGAYLVEWTGSLRVPRGAVLDDKTIGSTKHGIVRDEGNRPIGTYTRLSDNDGPNCDQNAMFITLND